MQGDELRMKDIEIEAQLQTFIALRRVKCEFRGSFLPVTRWKGPVSNSGLAGGKVGERWQP